MVLFWVIFVVVLYIVCSVIDYGLTLAYFQHKYPGVRSKKDQWEFLPLALFGPISLVAGLWSLADFNGWRNIFMYGFKLRAEDDDGRYASIYPNGG